MNGYIAYYNNKKIDVYADTSYQAQQRAAKVLNVSEKNRYKITVILAEKNNQQVTHIPDF